MLTVVGSNDNYLGSNLSRIIAEEGLRSVRTADIQRIIRELKKPQRVLVVDVAWEDVQRPGQLQQLVNIGNITGNKVICICPNQDEELKTLAKFSRAAKVFIRYDLETTFREYLRTLRIKPKNAP